MNVVLQAMTPNGRDVFFVTDSPLLDTDNNTGPDIYRFRFSDDPASDGNLTQISQNGDTPNDDSGGSLVGVSDDGERVYYQTVGGLVEVWDHGVTQLISDAVVRPGDVTAQLAAIASRPGLGRVTPDGTYFAFVTPSTLNRDDVHALTGEVTNRHVEAYLYNLRDRRLLCVSCPSGDATADVSVTPGATQGDPTISNEAFRPHFLSDRGQVFFSTAERLVPEDNNGVVDTYEYDPATRAVTLISSGTGSDPTTFADASPSGDDVFFVTRQRLVKADRDNLVDLYDGRVGPSLPEPPNTTVPPCESDGCQPPPSAAPDEAALGSAFLDDPNGSGLGSRTLSVQQRAVRRGAVGSFRVRLFLPGRLSWSGGAPAAARSDAAEVGPMSCTCGSRGVPAPSSSRRAPTRRSFTGRSSPLTATGPSRTTRVTFRAPAKKGR